MDRFCSGVYARLPVLHRGLATLQFAHGGHPPALVLRNDGGVQPAEATGMLLGVVDEPAIAQQATTLDAGHAVVLYTDGVTEARGRGGSFGLEHLSSRRHRRPRRLRARTLTSLDDPSGPWAPF